MSELMSTGEIIEALHGVRRDEYADNEKLLNAIAKESPSFILQCLGVAHDNGIIEASNSIHALATDMRTRAIARSHSLSIAVE